MTDTVSEVTSPAAEELVAEVLASRPEHPALARLHDSLLQTDSDREITSYDRMHHRHNRH